MMNQALNRGVFEGVEPHLPRPSQDSQEPAAANNADAGEDISEVTQN